MGEKRLRTYQQKMELRKRLGEKYPYLKAKHDHYYEWNLMHPDEKFNLEVYEKEHKEHEKISEEFKLKHSGMSMIEFLARL